MISPTPGNQILDLRVDITSRYSDSPVMNRISGDFYRQFMIAIPGRPPIRWRSYRESWIVDSPSVTWETGQVVISGDVRFWKGAHLPTTIRIVRRTCRDGH